MKHTTRLIDYVHHIQKYSEEALSFINGMSQADFFNDRKTQQATALNIITLGEISTLLKTDFPEFIDATPETPWRNIVGMRHRLVHGYNEVSTKIVWDTLTNFIPILIKQIPDLLKVAKQLGKTDT